MNSDIRKMIDKVKNFGKSPINEMRKSFMDYLREKLPTTPEYVIQDWFYKNLKDRTQNDINELINDYKDVEWELKKNYKINYKMFNEETQKRLKEREGGKQWNNLEGDLERHQTQKELIIKNGLPTEPIIILDLNGEYELIEGWHRTIQLFSLFPEGFEYPNVYVGKSNKSIYM